MQSSIIKLVLQNDGSRLRGGGGDRLCVRRSCRMMRRQCSFHKCRAIVETVVCRQPRPRRSANDFCFSTSFSFYLKLLNRGMSRTAAADRWEQTSRYGALVCTQQEWSSPPKVKLVKHKLKRGGKGECQQWQWKANVYVRTWNAVLGPLLFKRVNLLLMSANQRLI